MLSRIESESVELRGPHQFARAKHFTEVDAERFQMEVVPDVSSILFTAEVKDHIALYWVQTGKLAQGAEILQTIWYRYPQDCEDRQCRMTEICQGHQRFVTVQREQRPAGWIWDRLRRDSSIKTMMVSYAGVQLGLHTRW